jgi:hypothetical protein
MEFSNFDVLVTAADDDGSSQLRLVKDHVGNNRFQVLLDMHHYEFESTTTNQEQVVATVVDIVTKQCDPQGRFVLLPSHTVLPLLQCYDFVRTCFKNMQTTNNNTTVERTTSSSDTKQQHQHEQQPPPEHETNETTPSAPTSTHLSASVSLPVSRTTSTPTAIVPPRLTASMVEDDAKKRRRRSSLLRRSVNSESGVRTDTKKKSVLSLFRRNSSEIKIIKTAEPLDVVFQTNEKTLIPDHTGNNRLVVLVSIKQVLYQTAVSNNDTVKQQAMLNDLVSTVQDSWGGRFLSQRGRAYVMMSDDAVVVALADLLAGAETPAPAAPTKRPSLLLQVWNGRANNNTAITKSQDTTDNNRMRTAAVESLQRRKQRQGLAKKIRDLAQRRTNKDVRAQQDLFAQANFDSAPPMLHHIQQTFMDEPQHQQHYNTNNMSSSGGGAAMTRRIDMNQQLPPNLEPAPFRNPPDSMSVMSEESSRTNESTSSAIAGAAAAAPLLPPLLPSSSNTINSNNNNTVFDTSQHAMMDAHLQDLLVGLDMTEYDFLKAPQQQNSPLSPINKETKKAGANGR